MFAMQCPNCKNDVEYIPGECEICPECGNELNVAAIPEKSAKSDPDVFSGVDFKAIFSNISSVPGTEKTQESYKGLSERSKEIAEKIEKTEIPLHTLSECP